MEKGFDISTWQGSDIDFTKAKNQGNTFAILRVGFSYYLPEFIPTEDNCFEKTYPKAKKAGLKLGAYWYANARNKSEAIKEAEACMKYLKGKQFELPIFYDVEQDYIITKSASELKDIISAFCDTLLKNGYYAGVYCGFAVTDKVGTSFMNKYPVWFAQWYSVCQYDGDYGMWQFTEKLSVNGINGNVDGDYLYKDYTTIIKNGGYNGYTKATQTTQTAKKEISYLQLAFETINGKYGSGKEREKLLGNKYDDVQDIVNILLSNADMFLKAKELFKRGLLK